MKKLSTNQIRQTWLDFFQAKSHHFLAPVSLIPVDDPSLLWINSGVATLKPYFDGRKTPPAPRLTNSQKAIRTNDIENVGVTARHQTMFEMLGNFSIGDYFKTEAIEWAWELLTSEQWFGMPKEKLYITVFNEDDETYQIWTQKIGIAKDHIFALGRDTNFWDVGQGPCGPNTEIFFDRGEKWDPKKIGTKLLSKDIENDRYIEVWNIVFSQFNNDGQNHYAELPRKNIDTGAGLERLASIFQDTPTNFETDIFYPTIKKIETLTKNKYSINNYLKSKPEQTKINTAFKVIADHVRAVSFAIADGVFPGSKDRGYIIRRLIRRSSIYGRELGINQAFLYKLVDEVVKSMKEFYPYLKDKKALIVETIKTEEEKFLKTLTKGYELLEEIISQEKKVSGKNAFLLFESFGFPIEQTLEIGQKQGIKVEIKEFEKLLEESKVATRNARQDLKAWDKQNSLFTKLNVESEFTGWEETTHKKAAIVYMFVDNKEITSAKNQEVFVILDQTPFYAEKGGQAADTGVLIGEHGEGEVIDTQQGPNHQHIHRVKLKGKFELGDLVTAKVDEDKRFYTMKNHSGTHMVHSALREVLGTIVMQAGSYNDEHGLRMDFTFNRHPSEIELQDTQDLVNAKIKASLKREVYFCNMNDAINKYHALAFFTEKYDDIVRVVKFGSFSSELCGGTHVANTKDIESFLITGLESKGSGLFRIKALTSFKTIDKYVKDQFENYLEQSKTLMIKYQKTKKTLANSKLEAQAEKIKILAVNQKNLGLIKKLVEELNSLFKDYSREVNDLISVEKLKQFEKTTPTVNKDGINEIQLFTKGLSIQELKQLADQFRNKFSDLIIILGSENKDNNFIVVGVSESLQKSHPAIEIFKKIPNLKTQGGGNAKLAQGKYQKK